MGKTTQNSNTAIHDKEQTTNKILKSSSAASNIPKKKKSRSCSIRRMPAMTDSSTSLLDRVIGDEDEIHPSHNTSDNENESTTQLQVSLKKTSVVHKYATKISKNEYQCLECLKVNLQ